MQANPILKWCRLKTAGLTITQTVAQMTPEIMGWLVGDATTPATTLQHKKEPREGESPRWPMPLPSSSTRVSSVTVVNATTYDVVLTDGRSFTVTCVMETHWVRYR